MDIRNVPQAPDSTDIFIAGGGYAGLALALALSKSLGGDLAVTVAAPTFPRKNCTPDRRASALSASSRHILASLDIWRDIETVTQPVSSITITDSHSDDIHRPARLTYNTTTSGGEPSMYITENGALLDALYRHAANAKGVSICDGATVSTYVAAANDANITLADGRSIRARLVIAADGRQSTLRASAGIGVTGWKYDQRAIVALLTVSEPHGGRATQHFFEGGPFAVLPMTDNRVCVTWSEETAKATRMLNGSELDIITAIERRLGNTYGTLTMIGRPQSWPLDMHLANTFIAGRLALLGDAAHGVHPIAGQGLNLSLRDVAALTEVVADTARLGLDIGHGTTLERYQRWRRFDSVMATTAFDALNRLFSRAPAIERTIRGAGLTAVDRSAFMKQWLVDEASGLSGDRPKMLDGQLP